VINIGLIGCGYIGLRHIQAYAQIADQARVVALCDIDTDSAQAINKYANEARISGAMKDIFDDPEIEAVDICLPNYLHREAIIAAANAGKHILCEKPVSIDRDSAVEVRRVLADANVTFMCAHNLLFSPAAQRARAMLDQNILGELYEVRTFDISRWTPASYPDVGWRGKRGMVGGGHLMDTGAHPLYVMLYLMGKSPVTVSAMTSRHRMHEMEGEDSAQLLMEFDGGVIGHLATTYAYELIDAGSHPTRPWFQVVGEFGQLYGVGNELLHKPVDADARNISLPAVDNYFVAELTEFASCVREQRPPMQTFEDAMAVLKIVLCAYQSVEERRHVQLASQDW